MCAASSGVGGPKREETRPGSAKGFRWQHVRDSNPCRHLERVSQAVRPVLSDDALCLLNRANVTSCAGLDRAVTTRSRSIHWQIHWQDPVSTFARWRLAVLSSGGPTLADSVSSAGGSGRAHRRRAAWRLPSVPDTDRRVGARSVRSSVRSPSAFGAMTGTAPSPTAFPLRSPAIGAWSSPSHWMAVVGSPRPAIWDR